MVARRRPIVNDQTKLRSDARAVPEESAARPARGSLGTASSQRAINDRMARNPHAFCRASRAARPAHATSSTPAPIPPIDTPPPGPPGRRGIAELVRYPTRTANAQAGPMVSSRRPVREPCQAALKAAMPRRRQWPCQRIGQVALVASTQPNDRPDRIRGLGYREGVAGLGANAVATGLHGAVHPLSGCRSRRLVVCNCHGPTGPCQRDLGCNFQHVGWDIVRCCEREKPRSVRRERCLRPRRGGRVARATIGFIDSSSMP